MQSNPATGSLDVERRIKMAWLKTKKSGNVCVSKDQSNTHKCRKIRRWLVSSASRYFSADATWMQRHIAKCPRCQSRIALVGRVNLALSFMKSEPHSLDLLMRANSQAVDVLKHSLREMPKAQELKKMRPEPKIFQRFVQYLRPSGNLAACILILFLMKFGIFSSMENIQAKSRKAYKQYFVSHLGEEMTEDIFPGSFS